MDTKEYIPYTDSCFACGENNRHGIRLKLYREGERVKVETTIEEKFHGYRGIVHGGVVCALLDETMIWSAVVLGGRKTMYVTSEISVKYMAPVTTGEEVNVEGWIVKDRGRVVECEALVSLKGKPLAKGKGTFVALAGEKLTEVLPGIRFERAPHYKNFFHPGDPGGGS